jgi:hypothetical protein
MVQTGIEKKNSPKVKGTKVLKVVAKCGLVSKPKLAHGKKGFGCCRTAKYRLESEGRH